MQEQYNVLDFETTGLSPHYERVIEVGVIKVKDGKIIDSFESLINPGRLVPSFITSLTGITNQMLKDAHKRDIVFPKLSRFLGADPVVAHNASFDKSFLEAEFKRSKIKFKSTFLCSMLLSRRIFPDLGSYKLGVLCSHLNLKNSDAHRALSDVMVTQELFEILCSNIQRRVPDCPVELELLEELSRLPKKKIDYYLQKYSEQDHSQGMI